MQLAQGVLRSARPADLDPLVAFYAQDTSGYLIPRPRQDLLDAASSGLIFIVEQGGNIVAASGVFSYGVADTAVELSDSLVTAPVAGIGLQAFFLHLRVAHVVVTQGPDAVITTAVDPTNERSLRNVRAAGFEPWTPFQAVYAGCGSCPRQTGARPCCCDYFALPREAQRKAVASLLDRYANASVLLSRNTTSLHLSVECAILANYEQRQAARDFVDGDSW